MRMVLSNVTVLAANVLAKVRSLFYGLVIFACGGAAGLAWSGLVWPGYGPAMIAWGMAWVMAWVACVIVGAWALYTVIRVCVTRVRALLPAAGSPIKPPPAVDGRAGPGPHGLPI